MSEHQLDRADVDAVGQEPAGAFVTAAALAELCRRHGVLRLELFGFAAIGQDDPAHSDLDFLVEFEPLPAGSYVDAYFGVLEGLQAMFRRPVDLVVDSAIRNRYFRESVDQTKTLLYAA